MDPTIVSAVENVDVSVIELLNPVFNPLIILKIVEVFLGVSLPHGLLTGPGGPLPLPDPDPKASPYPLPR